MSSHPPQVNLRFRHIHLDFHTSPAIPGVGEKFDKAQWQDALRAGHVNSINLFSKCHHGWSYHPTTVGRMHPSLGFDLLRAQIEASKEIGVLTPIYVSAGVDNVMGVEHPEWREMGVDGRFLGWAGAINKPGFMFMCFNSPYLDYFCDQVAEVVQLFPECGGIWSDIIMQGECCCPVCLRYMKEHDLDINKAEDRQACAKAGLDRYYEMVTAAARSLDPNMPVFHNSGHVAKGRHDLYRYFSHLELESLPTGGWGYDHFPLSAKYCEKLDMDFLGMTGKFHTWWGEFGGYKHPNALKYECGLMLSTGAKCCVGDQLHPSGEMDMSTYEIIGAAYEEVEQKEPWCENVESVADIGLLSSEALANSRNPETGASRVLFEEQFLFDVLDAEMDFSPYKMLILPDEITVGDALKTKLDAYLAAGGKLLLTGRSGLKSDGSGFAFDIGAEYRGQSPFQPDYLEAGESLVPSFTKSPLVMYTPSQQVKPTDGEALAWVREPYFNRTWDHFCSHQHAPAADRSEYAAAVRKDSILYLAHPVFTLYWAQGAVAYREYIARAIRLLLGDDESFTSNMPSTARVSLMEQPDESRYVLHLLYANTIARGSNTVLSEEGYVHPPSRIEVIEELLPLHDVQVSLRLPKTVKRITLEPQAQEITHTVDGDRITLSLDKFTCHQMVVLHYQG